MAKIAIVWNLDMFLVWNTLVSVSAFPHQITTAVGTGVVGATGDGFAATAATLSGPRGVGGDSVSNIYISDYINNRMRKLTVSTAIISLFAGVSTTAGLTGNGGQATAAALHNPRQLYTDTLSNMYFCDTTNNQIRTINLVTNVINLFVGSSAATSVNSASLTAATLNNPYGLWKDSVGSLYISESTGNYIRKVSSSNIITYFAGLGTGVSSGDNGQATAAAVFTPTGLYGDSNSNLYIAEEQTGSTGRIPVISLITNIITSIMTGLSTPTGVWGDGQGTIYASQLGGFVVNAYSLSTTSSVVIAGTGVAATVTTISNGDGGAPTAAQFFTPHMMFCDTAT